MNNYRLYEATDFVLDDNFIQWVYKARNDIFWNKWLNQNPDKQLAVAEARSILQSLRPVTRTISENEPDSYRVDEEVSKLLNSIRPAEQQAPVYKMHSTRKWWWAAASVVLLVGMAILTITLLNRNSSSEKFSYASVTAKKQLIEHVNTSDKSLRISMPDGSTADLAPASRLSYANDFKDSANRDVFLSGEAFFSVTKNPKQPFRVFANGIVTKVLGTSFIIRSFEKEKTIKVVVRTGKVRVYSQTDEPENTGMNAIYPDDILLTPNQEAIFQKDQQKFQKKILEKPVIIDPGISQQSMIYEETPVIKVLEQFKKAYGLSIIYDEDSLRTCTITADLTDELLYSRLDLICKAIDANYEIINSEVFIRAKGCQ